MLDAPAGVHARRGFLLTREGCRPAKVKFFFRPAESAGTISQPCPPNVGSSFIRFVSYLFPIVFPF